MLNSKILSTLTLKAGTKKSIFKMSTPHCNKEIKGTSTGTCKTVTICKRHGCVHRQSKRKHQIIQVRKGTEWKTNVLKQLFLCTGNVVRK